jgi:hypothetical protein
VRETDLGGEKLRNDCYPKSEDKKYVTHAYLMTIWKLISKSIDFLDIKAKRKDDSGQTK